MDNKRLPIYISPDAQLKYLRLNLAAAEPELLELCERYINDGDAVWDIGANVGIFSFAAASRVHSGSVLAIEPDSFLVSLLLKTAKLPDYRKTKIDVLQAAAADRHAVTQLHIASRGRASNVLSGFGGRSQMGGIRDSYSVCTIPLDELLNSFQQPDFVKVDVEGAELAVLLGARRLIDEIRPLFYVELGADVFEKATEIMRNSDYLACDIHGNKLGSNIKFNVLFIPLEKYKG